MKRSEWNSVSMSKCCWVREWKTSVSSVCVCVVCRLWRRVLGGDHLHFHLLSLLEGPLQSQGWGHYGCELLAGRHCFFRYFCPRFTAKTSNKSPIKSCASKREKPRQETSGPAHLTLRWLMWRMRWETLNIFKNISHNQLFFFVKNRGYICIQCRKIVG